MVRLHVGHFRHASTRCTDQRNRIVVQPDGLLQRLPYRTVVADPLPRFVIHRDLCVSRDRRAQHTLTPMVVGVALDDSPCLPHRAHAVGMAVAERLAANADGVACRVVIARLAIDGEQAVAVHRMGVAGGACRRSQRGAIPGGVVGIGLDRHVGGAVLGLGQSTQCVVAVLGQDTGACSMGSSGLKELMNQFSIAIWAARSVG
ncbi:hypothetical protein D3C71_1064170 [compost metagenome]